LDASTRGNTTGHYNGETQWGNQRGKTRNKKNRKVISIKFNLFNSFKTINVCKLNFEKIIFSDFFFEKEIFSEKKK
jgi:hypothetical protein